MNAAADYEQHGQTTSILLQRNVD